MFYDNPLIKTSIEKEVSLSKKFVVFDEEIQVLSYDKFREIVSISFQNISFE